MRHPAIEARNVLRPLTTALVGLTSFCLQGFAQMQTQPILSSHAVPVITVDGLKFRDLNRDGKLQPFEDWRLSAEQRAGDLTARLSLEEKAGVMLHASAPGRNVARLGQGTEYDLAKVDTLIDEKKINTFITRLSGQPEMLAAQNNLLQEHAEHTRFAIPLTISTDPRNNFHTILGAQVDAGGFTQWPDMTGMAAIGDPAVVRNFANIARQEYLAVGINEALSPQADLVTEPRWPRQDGTFGENVQLSRSLVESYIAGFQEGESGLHPGSVACIVKHWVGYGAMRNGFDGHNAYGSKAVFPGGNFQQHVIPFEGAFKANVAGVMPTYAILEGVKVDGKPLEPVSAGFNKQLLTDLLRGTYGFKGVVLSDWLITDDCKGECLNGAAPGKEPTLTPGQFGMSWGVEGLTPEQRFKKGLEAGLDQFGGVANAEYLIDLAQTKQVPEDRLDRSVRRILEQKFAMGLFENPFVDAPKAGLIVGRADFKAAAQLAQEHSMVLLKNEAQFLPLKPEMRRVYLVGVDKDAAVAAGFTVVSNPSEAQFAIVRMNAPYQKLHPNYFFGSRQHEGDLDFKPGDPQLVTFEAVAHRLPTVVSIYLDRPAIVTPLLAAAPAVLANFGSDDKALLNVLIGEAQPLGKLPFQLPRTIESVRTQLTDVPDDLHDPLFEVGFGLRYASPSR